MWRKISYLNLSLSLSLEKEEEGRFLSLSLSLSSRQPRSRANVTILFPLPLSDEPLPRIRDPYFPATSRHLRTGVPDSSRQRQMGHGLAIGRSLQAVPRTTGVRWVGQTRREIRAPSPPPFLPFQRFNGHTPGRCCALRNETLIGGNFAIRFSDRDERILVRKIPSMVGEIYSFN